VDDRHAEWGGLSVVSEWEGARGEGMDGGG
jgi:hypothetical protein